jgi:acetyl-CoA C-acetyltransferase
MITPGRLASLLRPRGAALARAPGKPACSPVAGVQAGHRRGQRLRQYGLVNRVTAAGQALDGTRALAAEILEGSPTSVRVSLRVMGETRGIPDVIDAVTHPSAAVDDLMVSEDRIEDLTASAQKRPPQWRNR